VGRKGIDPFSVTFHDCQRLQRLRQKFEKAAAILENCMSTAKTIESIVQRMHISSTDLRDSEDIFAELQSYKNKISTHQITVRVFLGQSTGTMKIVRFLRFILIHTSTDYHHSYSRFLTLGMTRN
jgi:hypothetical protein